LQVLAQPLKFLLTIWSLRAAVVAVQATMQRKAQAAAVQADYAAQ
jgi:hypothetical protein